MTSLFAGLFRRAPQVAELTPKFPFTIETNPYRSKKTWPPDFTKLSQKHQFRLERRYRRRTKLKWARPNWNKGVKLVTWGSIVFVLTYGVLFLEVDEGITPFDGIRKWYNEQVGTMAPVRDRVDGNDNSPVAAKQPS
ncbi:hypothetical protein PRZ48_001242 [Zasmidium cellare]|uniref:Uncharacterized protein n=1 Tax=Zasmidium cellare TaxID=395010 RepID=A0ABR0F0Q4_ZASCE|nr:hypothetical protein PRZ48_001242 [Zasmidium cellare]